MFLSWRRRIQRSTTSSSVPRRSRLTIECLETRNLLSAVTETVLHSFGGTANDLNNQAQADGAQPEGNVTISADGSAIFGRTFVGGTGGPTSSPPTTDGGIIYSIATSGADYTVLHNFTGSNGSASGFPVDGFNPRHNAMTIGPDGLTLYGMTVAGGTTSTSSTNTGLGVIFSYKPSTATVTVLHSFTGGVNDGAEAHGSVVFSADGKTLYGMTAKGGSQNEGVLYSMSPDGTNFKILYTFGIGAGASPSINDGTEPHATPILVNNHLYGMTRVGGDATNVAGGAGVLFDFDLGTNSYSVLHRFGSTPSDGATPYHGTLVFNNNVLYGVTTEGGNKAASGETLGTIFSFNLAVSKNNYQILHLFTGSKSDGANPDGTPVFVNGKLYGVTTAGGANDHGTFFAIDPDGKHFQVLYSFHDKDGSHPIDSVSPVVQSDGSVIFYGMTQDGGTNGKGVLFAIHEAKAVIVTGSETSGSAVKVFDAATGALIRQFDAFEPGFNGGVTVATGDINGDGIADIVVGAGKGSGAYVKVFSGKDGTVLYNFLAYDAGFRGGVNVAVGDVDDDGFTDIITGAGPGGGPNVRVFSGKDGHLLLTFHAFDVKFTGGVNVAAGDFNQDGFADIVAGAWKGGGPHVRIFSGLDASLLNEFFAYDAAFRGGVTVAAGDFNGDGQLDIITGVATEGGPNVRVFDGANLKLLSSFFAFDPNFRGGVRVSSFDSNDDGQADIIASAGPGGGPHVRNFDSLTGSVISEFYAFDKAFTGGVSIGGQ